MLVKGIKWLWSVYMGTLYSLFLKRSIQFSFLISVMGKFLLSFLYLTANFSLNRVATVWITKLVMFLSEFSCLGCSCQSFLVWDVLVRVFLVDNYMWLQFLLESQSDSYQRCSSCQKILINTPRVFSSTYIYSYNFVVVFQ